MGRGASGQSYGGRGERMRVASPKPSSWRLRPPPPAPPHPRLKPRKHLRALHRQRPGLALCTAQRRTPPGGPAAATHARAVYCPPLIALPALVPHCRRRLGLARDWRVAVHWHPRRCSGPCSLPVEPGVVPSPTVWQRAGSGVQPSGLRLGLLPSREERF